MRTPDAINRIAASASHLAVWAGLYVAGAVEFLAQTGTRPGTPPRTRLLADAFAFSTAMGVYLLDRVKLADRWLDPADAQSRPDLAAFLAPRTGWIRALAGCLLLCGAALGWAIHPWLVVAAPLAAVGVFVYAGRPRGSRPRPKDLVFIKNAYVALGITAFAAIVVLAPALQSRDAMSEIPGRASHLVVPAALLLLRVFADAILCDLDDEHADRAHHTATLPTTLGRTNAWDTAFGLRLADGAFLAAAWPLPWSIRITWAVVTTLSSVLLRLVGPPRVRDWVDIRLPLEALAVAAVLALM